MDFYEEGVLFFLTAIEGSVVLPQVPVTVKDANGKSIWEAYPDFLALNFKKRQIQILEVSKSNNKDTIKKLVEKADQKYRNIVEKHVREEILKGELDEFLFDWRFFVRKQEVESLKQKIDKLGCIAEVNSIEAIFESIMQRMP